MEPPQVNEGQQNDWIDRFHSFSDHIDLRISVARHWESPATVKSSSSTQKIIRGSIFIRRAKCGFARWSYVSASQNPLDMLEFLGSVQNTEWFLIASWPQSIGLLILGSFQDRSTRTFKQIGHSWSVKGAFQDTSLFLCFIPFFIWLWSDSRIFPGVPGHIFAVTRW